MSIVKELNQSKDKAKKVLEKNQAISEVRLLLDADHSEDMRIARALGNNHSVAKAQKKVGQQIELEKLDTAYAGGVYKTSDIKALCVRYRMRFLQSRHFAGYLDKEVFAKIKAFAKETNTEISDANLQYNFFILAPDEAFNIDTERMPRVTDDPAIFYKIDEHHYRLIHKWGKDFTIARRWKGLVWQSMATRFWAHTVLTALCLLTGLYLFNASTGLYPVVFLSLLAGFAANARLYNISTSNREKVFTNHCWNDSTRYV